jgi:hypothetical protein
MRIFKSTLAFLTIAISLIVVSCRQAPPATPPLVIETQTVPVFSDPSGAEVTVDGISKGQTPVSLVLERNKDHMVVVAKEGYKPMAIPVSKNLNPQDLAVKSVLRMTDSGLSNDARNPFEELKISETTGRGYQLQPQVINVTLQPEK